MYHSANAGSIMCVLGEKNTSGKSYLSLNTLICWNWAVASLKAAYSHSFTHTNTRIHILTHTTWQVYTQHDDKNLPTENNR